MSVWLVRHQHACDDPWNLVTGKIEVFARREDAERVVAAQHAALAAAREREAERERRLTAGLAEAGFSRYGVGSRAREAAEEYEALCARLRAQLEAELGPMDRSLLHAAPVELEEVPLQ